MLYAVIIVSALVIVAAIPALLRARRTGYVHPAGRPTTGPRVREAVRRPGRPATSRREPSPRRRAPSGSPRWLRRACRVRRWTGSGYAARSLWRPRWAWP
ncbi:hypothetical protein I552_10173 [Mycobacterium xenopi 3993]|nr:hypothetical protein I552_10173 [Mycobacterium xenopi 3993]